MLTQIWISVPGTILAELGIAGNSIDVPGNWLKFYVDPQQGLTVVRNHFSEGKIDAGFSQGQQRPVARQRRYEVTVRESRYYHYLALERVASLSASASANNQPSQLITMRDFATPDYGSYIGAVPTMATPFTDRSGFILADSVKLSGTVQLCNPIDLAMTAPLQFTFVEAFPRL
jgi:hypothetical protein